jgi:hypothetical protein
MATKIPRDFSLVKRLTIGMYQLKSLDESLVFYYDETNNMRKFYVRENGFNWDWKANFVLGGLFHHRDAAIDVSPLIDSFKFPASMVEIKLKHFGKGDFAELLDSSRLTILLSFLKDNDLYVHFSCVNVLYFSLVDIVDSVLVSSGLLDQLPGGYDRYLKNMLYELSVKKTDAITELFLKYKYPNIAVASLENFATELLGIFEEYKEDYPYHVPLQSLEQLFAEALKKENLPFITDEEELVLLRDFSSLYFQRVYLFSDSQHIFDKEDTIQDIFEESNIILDEQILNNYQFVLSETDRLIQLSDVFCGLMGKFFIYLNSHSIEDILESIKQLSPRAKENLQLLMEVIRKSIDFNSATMHLVISDKDMVSFSTIEDVVSDPFFV